MANKEYQEILDPNELRIKVGKSYTMYIPGIGMLDPSTVHIDYILRNEHQDNPDDYNGSLVVMRMWSKRYGFWQHFICRYYDIAYINDWL